MKHMQKRLRDDELRVLRGEVEVDEAQLEADSADLDSSGSEDNAQQPRQAASREAACRPQTKVFCWVLWLLQLH